jgi:Holliday junction resolvase
MKMAKEFKQEVIKYLEEKGFNCVIQPKSCFPNIVAWKPFIDNEGKTLIINTQIKVGDEDYTEIITPYFVSLFDCDRFSKKKKDAAEKILEEGRCNAFFWVYKDKKKDLKFKEVKVKTKKENLKVENKKPYYPSYIR